MIFTDIPHPKDGTTKEQISITPVQIENWIRKALILGWQPMQNGPQFRVRIVEQNMVIL